MRANQNPFAVLKASTRDRKTRLIELAEEAELHGDHEAAIAARNTLGNPRARLAAEIAWFPGLSPSRVMRALEQIEFGSYPDMMGMNPLCRANFGIEALKLCAAGDQQGLKEAVVQISNSVEEIDSEDVFLAINEDRQAAGIPAITDISLVEAEIVERLRHFERTITAQLEELPTKHMVNCYEALVSWSTNDGEDEGQRLIEALVDSYELKAGSFLESEAERIKALITKAQESADRHVPERQVRASVNEIILALQGWDLVAQPIQLAYMSRGINHADSHNLAISARELAVHLFNAHDYLEQSTLLSEALQELFAEVPSVNDRIQDDIEALGNIAFERAEKAREEAEDEAEFARAITYETTFGTIFKDKFRISPDGFDYKGILTPLESISGVRWGAVHKSVNGIPSGTDYFFGYGTPKGSVLLQPSERVYKEIIQRTWRAVCVRILLGWMKDWAAGRVIKIGDVDISDDGIVLTRSRFFNEPEKQFFPWSDMTKSAHNGILGFKGISDKRFNVQFSYKDTWNIHVFDFAIDKIWEGKANKLSKIFGA
jgi:hypothetical protein